jgi:hypothetical protein
MPMSPIERMPIFGLGAALEEVAILCLGRMSKRGTSKFIESGWRWASGRLVAVKLSESGKLRRVPAYVRVQWAYSIDRCFLYLTLPSAFLILTFSSSFKE